MIQPAPLLGGTNFAVLHALFELSLVPYQSALGHLCLIIRRFLVTEGFRRMVESSPVPLCRKAATNCASRFASRTDNPGAAQFSAHRTCNPRCYQWWVLAWPRLDLPWYSYGVSYPLVARPRRPCASPLEVGQPTICLPSACQCLPASACLPVPASHASRSLK